VTLERVETRDPHLPIRLEPRGNIAQCLCRKPVNPAWPVQGVSRHLRVLREVGLVEVRQSAQFRIYSLRSEPLAEIDSWLDRYRSLWQQRLDALHTEVARGKKQRRSTP